MALARLANAEPLLVQMQTHMHRGSDQWHWLWHHGQHAELGHVHQVREDHDHPIRVLRQRLVGVVRKDLLVELCKNIGDAVLLVEDALRAARQEREEVRRTQGRVAGARRSWTRSAPGRTPRPR